MKFKRIVFRVWEVHLNYWFKLSCAFRYQCDRSNLLILSVAQNHYIKNLIHGFLVSIIYFSVSKLPSYFLQNSNNNNNNNVPFQLVSFSTKLSDFLEDISPGGLQVVLHKDMHTQTHTHTHKSQLFCIIIPQITLLFVSSDTKSPYDVSWTLYVLICGALSMRFPW